MLGPWPGLALSQLLVSSFARSVVVDRRATWPGSSCRIRTSLRSPDEDSEDDAADPDLVQYCRIICRTSTSTESPTGYKILESCPSLETDENLQELIRAQILHAWDEKGRRVAEGIN